jgi:hypothetical protein
MVYVDDDAVQEIGEVVAIIESSAHVRRPA